MDQMQQSQQENAMAIDQQKIEAEERKDIREKEHISRENQLDRESNERIAEIRSFTFVEDQDVNNNNVPDQLELERVRSAERMNDKKLYSNEKIAREKMQNDLEKERIKAKNKPKPSK